MVDPLATIDPHPSEFEEYRPKLESEGTVPPNDGGTNLTPLHPLAKKKSTSSDNDPTFASRCAPPDFPTADSTELLIGSVLGPYELLEKLGEGGMGAVYKARHQHLDKFVAVKVLANQFTHQPELISRFKREMKAVGKIDHPHIVRAMDAGEIRGTHYLAMEYLEGSDLGQLVKAKGTLSVTNACKAILQASLALSAAHEAGLIHRDIKPSNLFVVKNGQIKLLDLGLALLGEEATLGDGVTATGQAFGTPDYMAPEQWADAHAVDARTDLYALGCTLFLLLTGRPPYSDERYRTAINKMTGHASAPIPDLKALRSDVPDGLVAVYRKLMAKSPSDRYQTAVELIEALSPFASPTSLTVPPKPTVSVATARLPAPSEPAAETPRTAKKLAAITAVVITFGLLIALLPLFLHRKQPAITPPSTDLAPSTLNHQPLGPIDFPAERQAAEWVLSIGGTLTLVREDGTSLDLADGALPDELFAVRTLAIHHALLRNDDFMRLKHCRRLTELNVNNSGLNGSFLQHLQGVSSLTHLSMDGQTVTEKPSLSDYQMKLLDGLPQLQVLHIARNSALTDKCLADIGRLSQLRTLNLSDGNFTDAGLQQLDGLHNLTELHLENIPGVTDEGVARLISHNPHLAAIYLANFHDQRRTLAPLAEARNLELIFLSRDQLTPSSLSILKQLPKLKTIYTYNPDDETLALFAQLTQIEYLVLAWKTQAMVVSPAGFRKLAQHPELTRLEFRGHVEGITDDCLIELIQSPKLKLLGANGKSSCTPDGIAKFQSLRPDVKLTVRD